ncbi:Reticulon-4 receptor [Camelus dromedarius]|uniref:Reticulon-4 receptor n=1 Tax=Camelus dromedarius TaxID=9838 RepID=A0A5N4C9P1_CAMDR|nr:Reticulon-4 receptor [Camelus dromedarius]
MGAQQALLAPSTRSQLALSQPLLAQLNFKAPKHPTSVTPTARPKLPGQECVREFRSPGMAKALVAPLIPHVARGSQLLAWVLWLQAWRVAAPCPGACVCYNEPKVTTSCPQQGLQAVPANIPAASQRVFLHGNRITYVPAASFRACRNLTILWLHSNALARIDAAAFTGLALLEQLDLSDNAQLRAVDPTTFHGLGRLHTLHLDRCGLQELGPGLFRGLAALQYLYLQDNGLQALPDDAFQDLGNLTHLFLHGNRIPSVPERAFRGLHSLDRLLLHQNRVARVHPRAFRDLGRLMTLYLFANNLSALPAEALAPLRALQYLRLNDNPWVCDCRARPLWAWLQQFRGSSSEVPCSLPPRLAGRDLKRLAATDLEGCAVAARPSRPIRDRRACRRGATGATQPLRTQLCGSGLEVQDGLSPQGPRKQSL